MSDFVVHFTRGGKGKNDYESMMGIFSGSVLKAKNAFGIGKDRCPDKYSQLAVCFSEIPPGDWIRLKERRETKYGIGFRKSYIKSMGGGPIWYVYKDSVQWGILQSMMETDSKNLEADIWKITPYIDAPGEYGSSRYFFEWEREWRHIGDLVFKPEDVAFLLISEELHQSARRFFEYAQSENLGPAYFCPYVDPTWERERILNSLRGIG